jgi:hypothetical protein
MKRTAPLLTAVVVLLLAAGSASAGQIYLDRAAFMAAASGRSVTVEGFESFPYFPFPGGLDTTSLSTTSFTVSTLDGQGFLFAGTTGPLGPRPTVGASALIVGANDGRFGALIFDLNNSVFGVGFDLTDAPEQGDVLFSTNTGKHGVAAECCVLEDNPPFRGSAQIFFGYIDDQPFSQLTLTPTATWDGWGVDEVTLVSGVPDPGSSLLLLGMGLTGLGAARRRLRK